MAAQRKPTTNAAGDGGGGSPFPPDLAKELAKQNITLQQQEKIMNALQASGQKIVQIHREANENLERLNRAYTSTNRIMRDAIKSSNTFLINQESEYKNVVELGNARMAVAKLLAKEPGQIGYSATAQKTANLLIEEELGLLQDQAEAYGYTGAMAKYVAEQLEKGYTIEKIRGQQQFKDLDAYQKSIDFRKKHLELEKKMEERAEEILKSHNKLKDTLKQEFEFAKKMANDPKLLGAFLAGEMAHKVGHIVEGFEALDKSGLSVGQRVESMRKGFSLMSMVGLSDTKGVLEEMVNTYGSLNAMTKEQVNEVGHLAKEMGISGQEAFQLTDAFSKMPGETMESATNTAKFVKDLAKANGIAPGKVAKDIAKNTEAMALYGGRGAKEFAKSAVELHKMGIEISTASKMASGLLNFEDSINKQMEASVLLGREINFDKARELALAGDLAGAAKEVVKQAGGEAEWGRMNVLQKQKLAEAAGMTVEEMQKQIDAQKEHNKYFGEESGMLNNILGYTMEYGSAAGKFFKENGMLLMTAVQFMSNGNAMQMVGNGLRRIGTGLQAGFNGILKATKLLFAENNAIENQGFIKRNAQYIKDKAQAAWMATKKFFGGGAGKVAAGVTDKVTGAAAGKLTAGATDKVTGAAADKLTQAPGGKQTGGLTGAIEKIDGKKLLAGAAALLLVAAAVYVFAKAAQEFVSVPWSAIGKAIVAMLSLVGALALVGMIMMSGVGALAILAGAAAMLIMAAALYVLGKAIQEIAKGFDMFVPSLLQLAPMAGDLVALGASLLVLGAGMITFGAASFFAFPGMVLAGIGLGAVAVGLGLVAAAGAAAFPVIVGLTALAAMAPMFTELAGAISAMAVGLVAFASAGIFTLPTIAGLIALSLVAPVLIALGKSIQFDLGGGSKVEGGEGGKENDKMDVLIGKIDQLIAVASKGGTVNMDGKKVGEIVRLSINSSGVR